MEPSSGTIPMNDGNTALAALMIGTAPGGSGLKMTLFWKAEWMSHGSELPKVTSVYLETAEPIDWNSTMKVCAMISHRIAYTLCRLWRRGENFAAVRRRSEILAEKHRICASRGFEQR